MSGTLMRRALSKAVRNGVFLPKRDLSRCADGIITSGLADVHIPDVPIEEFVFEKAHKWENHIVAECSVTGRKYTYGQYRQKVKNLDRSLRKKMKLQKGDVVALLLPNVPEFPLACLGILRGGLTVTTINPIYTPDEISTQLIDSNAKAIITLTDFTKLAQASLGVAKKQLPILTINTTSGQSTATGTINFSEFTDNPVDFPDENSISSDDVAFLPYSSGTTGKPKGVELTHRNIVANLSQLEHPKITIIRETTGDFQDITPGVLPMFHIYGFTVCSTHSMRLGNKIVTLPKFTPDLYISVLKKYKPSVLYIAPPLAIFLANNPQVTKEDLQTVRTVMCGAAPLGKLDEDRLVQKADNGLNVMQGYGLTETSPVVLCTRREFSNDEKAIGSIGIPCTNTLVKLVNVDDPEGPAVPIGQPGEILVKGPQVMKGYHNRPEETEATFTKDGWLRTGDLMKYENGYLFVQDRIKELIKVKGFQVAPAELEEILRSFPNVLDAAVIGIPNESHGEVPRAYLVPKPKSKIDINNLIEYFNQKVAPYKRLNGGISIVESIPKNPSGKIMRRVLKDQHLQNTK